MGRLLIVLLICYFYVTCNKLTAQIQNAHADSLETAKQEELSDYRRQVDLIDLGMKLLGKNPDLRLKDVGKIDTKLKLSVGPIIEYTLSTGFTGGISAGAAFSTSANTPTNISSILFAAKYTQKKQFLLPIQTSLWLPGNKFLFTGDWRFLKYPQNTYGFGGHTTANDVFTVSYRYIRFYETALKKIKGNLYAGLGYQLDYHSNISQLDVKPGTITDFSKYGFTNKSTSSGLSIDLVYDSRKNSINPEGGSFFTSLMFLHNSTLLGSSSNSNSALVDIRKYFKLPRNLVLAFWSYNMITISGNPPYLDLPGTGSDTYNNTGRGYELGRFIGKKMVDLEAELRFGITKNGLLGGVIFTNVETVSELNNKFEVISPAAGIGLRVKFNKLSNTNACLDYGVGKGGSRGFFGNLGETF
jgi:hypothetical protein